MKSTDQILSFIKNNHFHTEEDLSIILTFCFKHHHFLTIPQEHRHISDNGITISDFLEWYKSGFGAGDIVEHNGKKFVLGICGVSRITIVGEINTEGLTIGKETVDCENYSLLTGEDRKSALTFIARSGYQFDFETGDLVRKYIPAPCDRVDFSNDITKGTGVIKDIDLKTGKITLFCYYLYNTSTIGYSMNEENVCDLYGFSFTKSTRGAQRRLNKELAKYGKEWYDKFSRIQPVDYKVEDGEAYYCINDKMRVVRYTEKNGLTSLGRRAVGNYFKNQKEAERIAEIMKNMLRDNLAR